jgi:transposase-like protein
MSSDGLSTADLDVENSRLRKELAEERLKKEILKKAILSSTSQRNTFPQLFCGSKKV